jgi:hypothetical protein
MPELQELIQVKIAPLGRFVVAVTIPQGSTVHDALYTAAVTGVLPLYVYDDLRKNGRPASPSDIVFPRDIITLVPGSISVDEPRFTCKQEPDPVPARPEPESEDTYARRFLTENPDFLEI